MRGLSGDLPKTLLEAGGKSLLEHKFDILPEEVHEVVLIVGYKGDKVRERIGDAYKGRKVRYITQENLNGTAGALWLAQDTLSERFLVMMGDDVYSAEDIARMRVHDWALLVSKMGDTSGLGKVILDERGVVESVTEGEEHTGGPGYICTNMFMLDTRVFKHPLIPKHGGSEEYGLPQTVAAASKELGIPLSGVEATFWLAVNSPEDLVRAEEALSMRNQ